MILHDADGTEGTFANVALGYYSPDVYEIILDERRSGDAAMGRAFPALRAPYKTAVKVELTRLNAVRRKGAPGSQYAINFEGYYAEVNKSLVVKEWGGFFPSRMERMDRLSMMNEHCLLIGLALGLMPSGLAIVPSLQGYAWLAEAGLVTLAGNSWIGRRRSLGILECSEVELSREERRAMHMFVRSVCDDAAARLLCDCLVSICAEIRVCLRSRFRPGSNSSGQQQACTNSEEAERVVSAMVTPVFLAEPEYRGLLTMLPADLVIALLLDWYEYEGGYVPAWWQETEKVFGAEEAPEGEGEGSRLHSQKNRGAGK
jgi:hypothetical protein